MFSIVLFDSVYFVKSTPRAFNVSFKCFAGVLQTIEDVHEDIPPSKRSFRGVYCFQSVRNSVIPSTFQGF